jgi:hypothetical protein
VRGGPWRPRAVLVVQVRQGPPDGSVRLRLYDGVTMDGGYAMGAAPVAAGRLDGGHQTAAAMGLRQSDQPLGPGGGVVRAAVVPPPPSQPPPGTARAKRAKAHTPPRAHPQGRQIQPPRTVAQGLAQTWGVCTTAPTVAQAVDEALILVLLDGAHARYKVRARVQEGGMLPLLQDG